VLFTWKVAFSITDSIAPLKFQEYGVSKEHMAYITSILMPMYICLPVLGTRWTACSNPMDLALWVYPLRVALIPITAALAYCTPTSMDPIPWGFYALVLVVALMGAVASEWMFVSQMAFFANISDPSMGGTYMTLLNTIANLGQKWPSTATFFLVDAFTCKSESCSRKVDGFYVMVVLWGMVGIVWYIVGGPVLRRLQSREVADWKLSRKRD